MRKKNNIRNIIILILIAAALIYSNKNNDENKQKAEVKNVVSNIETNIKDELLTIHYIDVGQADSTLISYNNKYVLIDAGNEEDGKKLVDYFNYLNIKKFDYVIATHPHEDHIGGMDDIINNFEIGNFYMTNAITTTKTFENVLVALENNNLGYKVPKINDEFNIDNIKFKVLYLDDDASNLNDDSIVLRLDFINNSFLFMADASKSVEKKILNSDIDVDVLKLGHHGSSYSSSSNFLDKTSPKYAIISVGLNNIYKHPSESVLSSLNRKNIKYYRTDEDGTIVITSDGSNIKIKKEVTDTNG